MVSITSNSKSIDASRLTVAFAALIALLGVACDWNQFGNGPTNPHSSRFTGPAAGIAVQYDLAHPGGGFNHDFEVGVLVDKFQDTYVSSYDRFINVYTSGGLLAGSYDLGTSGPRAVPYVHSSYFDRRYSMIFTGATGGGFYAIEVDKLGAPVYSLTLADADLSFGPSESSPKRAEDATYYIADRDGEVRRYDYAGGALTLLASWMLGEPVPGGIALYDVDPQYPDEEVFVATALGNLYVFDHTLSTIIWSNTAGAPTGDLYYAGVTIAERGGMPPVALLPIAHPGPGGFAPNSGKVRAIDLQTHGVAWTLTPSMTMAGSHAVQGSAAVLFEQMVPAASTAAIMVPVYHGTFASNDGFLYGVDLQTGAEVWRSALRDRAYDAPVVDRNNIIYVGDGRSNLYAVEGKAPLHGLQLWVDGSLGGGGGDVVKLGVHWPNGLVVGTGTRAFSLF